MHEHTFTSGKSDSFAEVLSKTEEGTHTDDTLQNSEHELFSSNAASIPVDEICNSSTAIARDDTTKVNKQGDNAASTTQPSFSVVLEENTATFGELTPCPIGCFAGDLIHGTTSNVLVQADPKEDADAAAADDDQFSDGESRMIVNADDSIERSPVQSTDREILETKLKSSLPKTLPRQTCDAATLTALSAQANMDVDGSCTRCDEINDNDKLQASFPAKQYQSVEKETTDQPSPWIRDPDETHSPAPPQRALASSYEAKTFAKNSHDHCKKPGRARKLCGDVQSPKMTVVHVSYNESNEPRVSTSRDTSLESRHSHPSGQDDEAVDPTIENSIVVAFVVGEDEVNDERQEKTLVHAVRLDPDSNSSYGQNRSLRFYALAAAVLFLVSIVVLSVAFLAPHKKTNGFDAPTPTPTAPSTLATNQTSIRATKYRNFFAQIVGDNVHNPDSSLYHAADWIANQDTLQLGLDHPNLLQRFMMAFLYFHTTDNRHLQWGSCNAPFAGEDDSCEYLEFTRLDDDSIAYVPRTSTRWSSSKVECDWAGIACQGDSTISEVSLLGQNLTGSLPSELATLSSLRSLILPFNQLTGTIPASYGNAFVDFEVHGNLLTGSIPVDFFDTDTKRLKTFNVGDNLLSGVIDSRIGLMSDLEDLHLYDNNFLGTLPTEVGDLTSLSYLRLNGNACTGSIPTELGRLSQLLLFWTDDNRFIGTISSEVGQLSLITDFRLARNMINGTIPNEIFNMSKLQFLDLSEMRLTGTLSTLVGRLTELQALLVSKNQLTGTIPSEIQNMSSLVAIWLHLNLFTGQVPTEICSLLVPPMTLDVFETDCLPVDNPSTPCTCCSACCDRDSQNCVMRS